MRWPDLRRRDRDHRVLVRRWPSCFGRCAHVRMACLGHTQGEDFSEPGRTVAKRCRLNRCIDMNERLKDHGVKVRQAVRLRSDNRVLLG